MFQTLLKNKILITVIVLLVGAVGYYAFFAPQPPIPGVTPNVELEVARDEVLSALSAYENFRFNAPFLNEPRYTSLTDLTAPIPSQQPGRANPFAPAGQ